MHTHTKERLHVRIDVSMLSVSVICKRMQSIQQHVCNQVQATEAVEANPEYS